MAGWEIVHLGQRLWRATKREARQLAQDLANQSRQKVTVRPAKAAKAAAATVRRPPAKQPARMKRNPDPLAFVPFWTAQGQAQAKRREYVAATKGRRLAKSLRGADRGGAAKAAEAGARKSAKFKVHATNKRDTLTLYRPSRRAADDLAAQFVAAGYTVTVSGA